jgi:rhamnogalacturonyl hydrolase YesR
MASTLMEKFINASDYPWGKWSYPQGYMLMGMNKLWQSTQDKKYFDYIMAYANEQVDNEGNLRHFKGWSMDDMMTGSVIVWAYTQTKEPRFKIAAEKIRKSFEDYPRSSDSIFWHNKDLKGEIWIDGVFMGEMFLTMYGKYIDDGTYCFNEAARQLIGINKHLKKGETGLMYHAWDEDKDASWADKETGLSCDVWGEGLGWYALMIVETLDLMPSNHPRRKALEDIAKKLMYGLKNTQDSKTGLWYDIVDKGNEPGNFLEASGTSMFLYALKKSMDLNLINATEFKPVVDKAYKGLITKAQVSPVHGLVNVIDACDGVGVQNNYQSYVNYPKQINAKEAVAGFLWGTWIYEKDEIGKMYLKKK